MPQRPWNLAAYWDGRFQIEDTPWDMGGVSPTLMALEERLSQERKIELGSSVLVPGCGSGHDALHFAKKGYKVSAVDFAKFPLDDLRVRAKREQISIEVLLSDFWRIPESWFGTFDLVVEHTFFCAIDPDKRPSYVEQVLKLLKPKGMFLGSLFVESSDGTSLLGEGGPPFLSSEQKVRDLFDSHFDCEIFEPSWLPRPGFEAVDWAAAFKLRG